MRKIFCFITLLVILLSVPMTSMSQTPQQKREKELRREAMVEQVVAVINAVRAKHNLPEVEPKRETSRVAQIKAEDMLANSYYKHLSPTYGMPDAMLRKYNIRFTVSAENIAWAGVFCSTAEEVVEGWLDITADKENLLNPDFTKIGVGFAENPATRKYHWVVMLTD